MTLPPASATLTDQLHDEVSRGSIVLWLDRHSHYTQLAEALAAQESPLWRTICWQGSHLEVLLALESLTQSSRKPRVVLHLPGFTEADVRQSPLLELWSSGRRFRKALTTLTEESALGRVPREDVEAFVASDPQSLAEVDRWLAAQLSSGADITTLLDDMSLPDLALDLLTGGSLSKSHSEPLWQAVRRRVGLDAKDWLIEIAGFRRPEDLDADRVGYALASWALCVEFVQDLHKDARAALTGALAEPASLTGAPVQDCLAVCQALRARDPKRYATLAGETEALVAEAVLRTPAEQLGHVDTFVLEANKVLSASCEALIEDNFAAAANAARARLATTGSFWLDWGEGQRRAWDLVAALARLGLALQRAGRGWRLSSVDELAARYARDGAPVDRAHRELEALAEQAMAHHDKLPERLSEALGALRDSWSLWATELAEATASVCEHAGWLPAAALQQRTLFDQQVAPWADARRPVAYFMVDALRYEMGLALSEAIQAEATHGTTMRLEHRLAELPTETSVGMNALTPMARGGQLEALVGDKGVEGFRAGTKAVRSPPDRQKAMHDRVGGEKVARLELPDLLTRSQESLERLLRGAMVVMVESREIDQAGESAVGPQAFSAALEKLEAAWRRLRQVGVRRFVITADHGFLYQPKPTRIEHGSHLTARRRYALRDEPTAEPGMQAVRLSSLGYEGPGTERCLHLPRGLGVMTSGGASDNFVHGGNSPQERVIPVLLIEHRSAGGRAPSYTLQAEARQDGARLHLSGRLLPAGLSLGFGGVSELRVVLETSGDAALVIQSAEGAGVQGDDLLLEVDRAFSVTLEIVGQPGQSAGLTLAHRAGQARVSPVLLPGPYALPASAPEPSAIGAHVPEDYRATFEHLLQHGALGEPELYQMLGRRARRFASKIEAWAAEAGVGVKIDVVDGIKRYEVKR